MRNSAEWKGPACSRTSWPESASANLRRTAAQDEIPNDVRKPSNESSSRTTLSSTVSSRLFCHSRFVIGYFVIGYFVIGYFVIGYFVIRHLMQVAVSP